MAMTIGKTNKGISARASFLSRPRRQSVIGKKSKEAPARMSPSCVINRDARALPQHIKVRAAEKKIRKGDDETHKKCSQQQHTLALLRSACVIEALPAPQSEKIRVQKRKRRKDGAADAVEKYSRPKN
jgi:hypothetical protein